MLQPTSARLARIVTVRNPFMGTIILVVILSTAWETHGDKRIQCIAMVILQGEIIAKLQSFRIEKVTAEYRSKIERPPFFVIQLPMHGDWCRLVVQKGLHPGYIRGVTRVFLLAVVGCGLLGCSSDGDHPHHSKKAHVKSEAKHIGHEIKYGAEHVGHKIHDFFTV